MWIEDTKGNMVNMDHVSFICMESSNLTDKFHFIKAFTIDNRVVILSAHDSAEDMKRYMAQLGRALRSVEIKGTLV